MATEGAQSPGQQQMTRAQRRAMQAQERLGAAVVYAKTKMCKFHSMGMCTQGDNCKFAHRIEDLQQVPDLSKTKLCKAFMATSKCENAECCYAHGEHELRSVEPGFKL